MPDRTWNEAKRVRFVTRLLSPTFGLRSVSTIVKYSFTLAIVGFFYVLRMMFDAHLGPYPFLLFFPAVIICSLLFDHGSGIIAAIASAMLGAYILHDQGLLRAQLTGVVLSFPIFLFIALSVEALQETTHILQKTMRVLSLRKEELEQIDAEKDLLIRETAHRVRNDLATLSSMVRLQSRGMTGDGRAAMDTVAHRLAVLVSLHQRLAYEPGSKLGSVNSEEFLSDLINEIRVTMVGIKPIHIDDQIERHIIAHQTGIALGLIMNEALTNAAKYAFIGKPRGEIRVVFRRAGESYNLSITDDGHNTGEIQGTGLGTRLMESMTAQIDGEITVDRTKGTRVCVVFPVNPIARQA
jgi:two-component sensor histidine kinase